MKEILFLHYGPGGNSGVEKFIFSDCPKVDFWDQPECFSKNDLILATQQKIHEVFSASDDINIVAHSYGCNLLFESLNPQQALRTNIILVSPISSISWGFINLAKKLLSDKNVSSADKHKLKHSIDLFENNLSRENFWTLFTNVTQIESFSSIYWHSRESQTLCENILKTTKPFRFNEWKTIVDETYSTQKIEKVHKFKKMTLVHGTQDPYLTPIEVFQWNQIMNNLEVVSWEAGHYPHLEQPILFKQLVTDFFKETLHPISAVSTTLC